MKMIKPNDFEKMPGKDPANEKQRTYYLDYLLKKKAKEEVLRVESENKCKKLQEQLGAEEIILRTRTKTVVQLAVEKKRIEDFVIEEPAGVQEVIEFHDMAKKVQEPEITETKEPEEPDEVVILKKLIEIDPDTIPEAQKAEFFKWLKQIEK